MGLTKYFLVRKEYKRKNGERSKVSVYVKKLMNKQSWLVTKISSGQSSLHCRKKKLFDLRFTRTRPQDELVSCVLIRVQAFNLSRNTIYIWAKPRETSCLLGMYRVAHSSKISRDLVWCFFRGISYTITFIQKFRCLWRTWSNWDFFFLFSFYSEVVTFVNYFSEVRI